MKEFLENNGREKRVYLDFLFPKRGRYLKIPAFSQAALCFEREGGGNFQVPTPLIGMLVILSVGLLITNRMDYQPD